jgi:hypothetical protein
MTNAATNDSATDTMKHATELFDTAVEAILEKNPRMKEEEAMLALDARDRDMVVIAIWDSQVKNGGATQWCDNGYHVTGRYLLHALKQVGSDTASKVYEIVETALEYHESPSNEEDYEEWADRLDGLDDQYYAIEAAFLAEVVFHFFPEA